VGQPRVGRVLAPAAPLAKKIPTASTRPPRMPNYRRNFVPGGTFFFTAVTHYRRPILISALARRSLRQAFAEVRGRRPITIDAIVLLPDHLHCIWTLPPGDAGFDVRWRQIKTVNANFKCNSFEN
jgi:REP element-mobilizing transposase RayT